MTRIFYTYKNKRRVKNDYVSLKDINSYNWLSKDFKSENLSNRAIILYDSTDNLKVGIKLTQHFNYPILHMAPTLSIYKKNHNVYIGPEYTILRKNPLGDPIDTWEKTAWGLNFGYRYIINSFWENTNLFVQINFSIYQVKSKEYQLGPPFVTVHKNTIIENTGDLGCKLRLCKQLEIFGGMGIGSTNGFFLMIDQFIPHAFLGIEFKNK